MIIQLDLFVDPKVLVVHGVDKIFRSAIQKSHKKGVERKGWTNIARSFIGGLAMITLAVAFMTNKRKRLNKRYKLLGQKMVDALYNSEVTIFGIPAETATSTTVPS